MTSPQTEKKETNRTNCCCIWSLAAGKLQRCTKRIWLKWFHLPARPNECVSPQGSVEAQCGLVLNGQGGVIRRGKAPVYSLLRLLLLLLLLLYRRPWHSRARHDKTASRQTNRRNTPLLSAVNTLQQERPRFVTYLNSSAVQAQRQCSPLPACHSTPTFF